MTGAAVEILDVSKRFRRHRDRRTSLKERIVRGRPQHVEDFWALREVSLSIPKGSVYGLVGHNGCGKSTLLKLIGGIYRPTSGSVHAEGRVAALIELGAGFHPDMTGRENIALNGSILGLDRREVAAAMDEIIDFSGLGEFIDEPVKNFSSGMYVRLGFSVAVHMRPDVLLIDEVIAVGDEDFQRRCFDHLYKLRRSGRTIVVVSHSLGTMESLCDEAAWLDHGRLRTTGGAARVVETYKQAVNDAETARAVAAAAELPEPAADDPGSELAELAQTRSGSGEIRVVRVEVLDRDGHPVPYLVTGEDFTLRLGWEARERIGGVAFGVDFYHESGACLNSVQTAQPSGVLQRHGHVDVRFPDGPLNAGHYRVKTAIADQSLTHDFDRWPDALELVVRAGSGPERYGLVSFAGDFRFSSDVPATAGLELI